MNGRATICILPAILVVGMLGCSDDEEYVIRGPENSSGSVKIKVDKKDVVLTCDGCGKKLSGSDRCYSGPDEFKDADPLKSFNPSTYCSQCEDKLRVARSEYDLWCKCNYGGRIMKDGMARQITPYLWENCYRRDWVLVGGVEKAKEFLQAKAIQNGNSETDDKVLSFKKILASYKRFPRELGDVEKTILDEEYENWKNADPKKKAIRATVHRKRFEDSFAEKWIEKVLKERIDILESKHKAIEKMCDRNLDASPIPSELCTLSILEGNKSLKDGAYYVSTNCDIILSVDNSSSPEAYTRKDNGDEWRAVSFHMSNVRPEHRGGEGIYGVVDNHTIELRLPRAMAEKLEKQEKNVRLPAGWYTVFPSLDDEDKPVFAGTTTMQYMNRMASLTVQEAKDIWLGRKVFRNHTLVSVGDDVIDYDVLEKEDQAQKLATKNAAKEKLKAQMFSGEAFSTAKYQGGIAIMGLTKEYENVIIPAKIGGLSVTSIHLGRKGEIGNKANLKSIVMEAPLQVLDPGAFSYCPALTSVTLPSSIVEIGEMAFWNCRALEKITLPNAVKKISEMAFLECSALKQIILPDGLESIGDGTFANCSKLHNVELPSTLRTIGDKAFINCSDLFQITIPASVRRIGEDAFGGCYELKFVQVSKGDEDRIKQLLIKSKLDISKISFEVK